MLPEAFLVRMKALLKDDYEAFIRSYEITNYKALRLNPLKADKAQFLACMKRYEDVLENDSGNDSGNESDEHRSNTDKNIRIDTAGGSSDKDDGIVEGADDFLGEVTWEENGFYYPDFLQPGKHPYHAAGVYYIQEPSAMYPVSLMGIEEPFDDLRILDLCASPGGKTTQIAGKMKDRGLLIANEIIPQRASVLSENIERMGISNTIVLNERPDHLKDIFIDYFDRILVDAPCSGEGMFKKNEQAVNEWSIENIKMCAVRQDEILDAAADMLKPGGRLVYSTCTFSREEDEDRIERFIIRHPEYRLIKQEKLLPHEVKGEGQYAACLVRDSFRANHKENECSGDDKGISAGEEGNEEVINSFQDDKGISDRGGSFLSSYSATGIQSSEKLKSFPEFIDFIRENLSDGMVSFFEGIELLHRPLIKYGDTLYLGPCYMPGISGLKCLRPGLELGTIKRGGSKSEARKSGNSKSGGSRPGAFKSGTYMPEAFKAGYTKSGACCSGSSTAKKGRFEPSHALALYLKPTDVKRHVNIDSIRERKLADDYLKGMTFEYTGDNGYYLICVDGYSIGWGKLAGNIMKNHYPKGLRVMW